MNRFERWFLKRIIARQVVQGDHFKRIEDLYSMIAVACREEFYEDNNVTVGEFCNERFQKSLVDNKLSGF